MSRKDQPDGVALYGSLMMELKLRMDSIDKALDSKLPLPGWLVAEYVFLQFRMICELIALGCLLAHGDIDATHAPTLKRAYSADKIMTALEGLHPDFYPKPITSAKIGRGGHQLSPVLHGFLTKDELLKLNGECGNILHRGSVKRLLAMKPIERSRAEIRALKTKIVTLLDRHIVEFADGNPSFICVVNFGDVDALVEIATLRVPG